MAETPGPARILVVDDDPDILGLIGELLRSAEDLPNETVLETNPHEAVARLEREKFDLVISDYMMPRMDGGELLLKVKTYHPKTLRILMTAHPTHQSALLAVLSAEVHSYIEKPFDTDEVVKTIRDALHRPSGEVDGLGGFVDPADRALNLVRDLKRTMAEAPPEATALNLTFAFPSTGLFNQFTARAFQDHPGEVKDIRYEGGRFLVTISCTAEPGNVPFPSRHRGHSGGGHEGHAGHPLPPPPPD